MVRDCVIDELRQAQTLLECDGDSEILFVVYYILPVL